MRRPELLIPAGDLETLRIAVMYGADAIYLGGEEFSLRAKAKNFSMEDLKAGIDFAHEHHVRVYIAANIFARNEELEGIRSYFERLKNVNPDALIISDAGVLSIAKEVLPDVEMHISTQWSNANYRTYRFWYEAGANKVVAARELTLEEIKEIRNNIPKDMQIECFIHGAMCISYSGKCLLSNYFTGKDSNHGECTHPCRWKYTVYERTGDGEYEPLTEQYAHLFNSKDLCMIDHIPDLIDAGIDSFKIEGRMKTALYVATVARTYRKAIDDFLKDPELYKANMNWYLEEICKCTYRDFCTGFFYGKPDSSAQIYDSNTYIKKYTYLGFVERIDEEGLPVISQRNKFCLGDEIEIMKPDGRNIFVQVKAIYDKDHHSMESAPHPQQELHLELTAAAEVYDILRAKD